MRRFIIYFFLACIVVSCTPDNGGGDAPKVETIYAELATASSVHFSWTTGDEIRVLGPGVNSQYRYEATSGETKGDFALVQKDKPRTSPTFTQYYACIPYGNFQLDQTDGKYKFVSLKGGNATQKYVKDGCDMSAGMLYATNRQERSFKMKSVLGFLRIKITGNKKVKEIKLSNNADVSIAGRFRFVYTDPSKVKYFSNESNTITLDCGEGVQLSSEPTCFHFQMIPLTMADGFRLEILFTDGTKVLHGESDEFVIKANSVKTLDKVIALEDVDYAVLKVVSKGKKFQVPEFDTTEGYADWGDGLTDPLGIWTTYTYTDEGSTHTATFYVSGATKVNFSGCEGVSEIDLSNF